jgi:hypothetical protein
MRASTMQLERREAIELVLSFMSLVAIGSSDEAFQLVSGGGTGSEVKTNEVEKSYKESGALNQKHRGGKSCDERKYRSYTTYWTYI